MHYVYRYLIFAAILTSFIAPLHSSPSVSCNSTLSEIQVRALAEAILENTPEHIHWAPDTTFDWVVLSEDIKSNPADINEAVISLLKNKYKAVYSSKSDIPKDKLHYYPNSNNVDGYEDGFLFSWTVEIISSTSIKVTYSDWEGNMASSYHSKTYKWQNEQWVIVHASSIEVS